MDVRATRHIATLCERDPTQPTHIATLCEQAFLGAGQDTKV